MDFMEYKAVVADRLSRRNIRANVDYSDMFESYVGGISPERYAACTAAKLCESSGTVADRRFGRYVEDTLAIVRRSGYNILRMPRELDEDLCDMYSDGYSTSESAGYIVEQLDKNAVKDDSGDKLDGDLLYGKLVLLFHNIDGAAVRSVTVDKEAAYADIRVKLFDLRNELDTGIKEYLAGIDARFRPYVKQNTDNENRIEVLGYNVNQGAVFCTVRMRLDFIGGDEQKISMKETANTVRMYVNIFQTFGEQFRNLL